MQSLGLAALQLQALAPGLVMQKKHGLEQGGKAGTTIPNPLPLQNDQVEGHICILKSFQGSLWVTVNDDTVADRQRQPTSFLLLCKLAAL